MRAIPLSRAVVSRGPTPLRRAVVSCAPPGDPTDAPTPPTICDTLAALATAISDRLHIHP